MSAAPYEMLLRHPQLLDSNTLILGAEPRIPGDLLLQLRNSGASLHSWDWMTKRAATGIKTEQIRFGVPDAAALAGFTRVIVLWPKSKPLALALVRLMMEAGVEGYAVGANDAGGKSIGNACKGVANSERIDNARHCTLWVLTADPALATGSDRFNWLKQAKAFQYQTLTLLSLPGVFSHGSLDQGTALLLQHLPRLNGSLLDIGCGSGVIGLSQKQQNNTLQLTLADTDALALKSAALNCARLGLDASLIPSDGFSDISGRFDTIVSNPPFHTGKETDYRFAEMLLSECASHLHQQGSLWLVANRHLAYEEWAQRHFANVEIVDQGYGFKVIHATHPA
jgi:16S rRNA (guanine1207-N2)-methyltransferase